MRNRPVEPLELELLAACGPGRGFYTQLAALWPALAEARGEVLPAPTSLLEEYRSTGGRGQGRSRLGHILATARRLADEVDRVVIVAAGDACLTARAVLESCAHPYHNELSRAERGGYPRVDLAPQFPDNDALQGLLDLLATPHGHAADLERRWALVTIDDGTSETAAVGRVLAQALQRSLGDKRDRFAAWHVTVPDGRVASTDKLSSAGVLLPAALAGIDAVGLLSGANAMQDRFARESPEANPALRLAGLCHLTGPSVEACQMTVWAKALEAAAEWYRRLRELAWAANQWRSTTGLHLGPLPEKIIRPQLVLHVAAGRVRRDRLTVDELSAAGAPSAVEAGRPLPELAQAMLTAAVNRAAEQPAALLRLPQIDERSVGQMLHMLELATAVEARLAIMQTSASRGRHCAMASPRDIDSTHHTP